MYDTIPAKIFAGIALGLALSKYTLGVAAFIYFVYKRQWISLLIALILQLSCFLLLGYLTQTSTLTLVETYIDIASVHTNMSGVHLGSYLNISSILSALLVSILFGGIYLILVGTLIPESTFQIDMAILSLTIGWSLLVVYHRHYDLVFLSFNIYLVMVAADNPIKWRLSPQIRNILRLFLLVTVTALCIPGSIPAPFIPSIYLDTYYQFISLSGTICVLLYSGFSFYLLYKLRNDVSHKHDIVISTQP